MSKDVFKPEVSVNKTWHLFGARFLQTSLSVFRFRKQLIHCHSLLFGVEMKLVNLREKHDNCVTFAQKGTTAE